MGYLTIALLIAALALGACSQPASVLGKWKSSSGEEMEFVDGGTVLTNIPGFPSGTWSVTPSGSLTVTTTVLGTSTAFVGCYNPSVVNLRTASDPDYIHYFKEDKDGHIVPFTSSSSQSLLSANLHVGKPHDDMACSTTS
jgi:hypothetical protein